MSNPELQGGTERPASAKGALASLSLSMLLSSLGTSSANVGLPALAQAFDASFAQVQWVVLAYLLAVTTLIVGVGRLGDMAGRRRLLLTGIAVFTVASVLCGMASALWQLVAARALQGVGAAIMMALAFALVSDTIAKARIGAAIGWLGTMSAVGTALGPSLGGLLIAGFGWPAIFLVNVPLGLLALWLARRNLPVDRLHPLPEGSRFDLIGTLLLALTLAAYALAMSLGQGRFGRLNLALLVIAAFAAGLFVLVERRLPSPLIRLELLRNRALVTRLATSALVATVMMATLVVGPFYLAQALGLSAAVVGFTLTVGPLVAALSGVPAGRWVDRWGSGRMTIAGLVAMEVGAILLSLVPSAFGIAGYVAAIVVLTAGYALFQAANTTVVIGGLSPDQRGVVSGLLSLSRNLGLITGASVMGAVFALSVATSDLSAAAPEAVAYGMRITFAVAALLIVVSIVMATASPALARSDSMQDDFA